MANPTTVVISVRSGFERTGWIHPHLCSWLISTVFEPIHRLNCELIHGVYGLAASANASAKGFMERPEFANVEWLCIIDNDTAPQHDILRILDDVPDHVDILSPQCHMTQNNYVFPQQGFYKDKDGNPVYVLDGPCDFYPLFVETPGLYEVDRVGGGCWFIRRRVFNAMSKPYFKVGLDPETFGVDMTDDVYFQDTARKLGFRLFTDTRYVASHYHTINMALLPQNVELRMPNTPRNEANLAV